MDDLRKEHVPPNTNNSVAVANGNRLAGNGLKCSGIADKRLPLYGYSIETINMLLIPMIQSK